MPTRNDHGSDTTAGGEDPQEPLIDRQLELDLLRQHIARVTETGKGHAVLILGESGVGKSRLAAEAAAKARERGMTVISVRCLGRGAEPLLPLKEALASHLGRTRSASAASTRNCPASSSRSPPEAQACSAGR
jgi:predicted ATPase